MNKNKDMNVKDAFLTDWDVKLLLKNGFENRKLTKKEITCIKALQETALKFDFADNLVYGVGKDNEYDYITKIYNSVWATYTLDDKGCFCCYAAFRNCESACIELIKRSTLSYEKIKAMNYFKNRINYGLSDATLNDFAMEWDYSIVNENKELTRKLKN